MGARLGEGQANEDKGSGGHHSTDSLTRVSGKIVEAVKVRSLPTQYQSDP